MHKQFGFGILLALIVSVFSWGAPVRAQSNFSDLLTMSITAGYDTFFRPDIWLPVRIDIENNGSTIKGDILIRPATSGIGIEHTYTTPVELPQGRQSLFLYITARDLANNVRVELVNENGETLISIASVLRSLAPRDSLFVVVSGALNSRLDLSDLHPTGYNSYQIRWRIANLPDRAEGLNALTMLIFNDVDTNQLSLAQRDAIRTWVLGGGHLVVMGGANWQATASGLNDILPFSPTNTRTTSEAASQFLALSGYSVDERLALSQTDHTLTLGTVRTQGTILAGTEDNLFVIRQTLGNGTVDYITMNLEEPPFSDVAELSRVFLWLISTAQTPIGWSYGFNDWANANTAVQILPGVDLLPAVLSLISFLGAYILLIGPVNYLFLRTINRRGLAWVTIPIFIIIFTALAWSVGVELRGTDARLSRLTVIQAWHNADEAKIDQLIGLLAPRRGNYTLMMDDNRALRPILTPRDNFTLDVPQTNIQIRQTSQFAAIDVPVDASFISAFNASGITEKPNITGTATWVYRNGSPLLRGSVRNNTDILLTDVVILARGIVRPLGDFAPGAILTFETDSPAVVRETAMPAPIEFPRTDETNAFFNLGSTLARTTITRILLNARDILGEEAFDSRNIPIRLTTDQERQLFNRKRALIASFMIDQYGSRARGNRVFLVGWSDIAPTQESMAGQGYSAVDTTLYIIEIPTETAPTSEEVIITKDQFTWVSLPDSQIANISPNNLNTTLLDNNIVAFRFTPVADARLASVSSLVLLIDRTSTSLNNAIELWDWQMGEWVSFTVGGQTRFAVPDHERFIGTHNAVQLRTTPGISGGSRYIQQLGIEQRGMLP